MPHALWVSVLCEAFGCLPSAAERELERCPPGWLQEILEARQYSEAFHLLKSARNDADVPTSPMVELVRTIEAERAVDAYHAKKAAKTNG